MRNTNVMLMGGLGLVLVMVSCTGPKIASGPENERADNVKEYVFKTGEGYELKIFVHLPDDWKQSDRRPGIIFFFGGGFRARPIGQFTPQAEYLAKRGMVVARGDNRVKSLHGTSPYEALEDARSAMRWFRAHADEFGMDPDRIVGAGGSAGALLSAACAITDGPDCESDDLSISPKPNLLVLFNPPLRFVGSERMMERFGGDEEKAKLLSPVLYITRDTPAALLMYGTEDRLLAHGKEFIERSKELGNRAELFLAEGETHAFFNRSPWLERTLRRADEFLVSMGYLEGEPTVKEGQFADIRRPYTEEEKQKRRQRQPHYEEPEKQ